MSAPRLERLDLVDMARSEGEHYPYEVDVEVIPDDDGPYRVVGDQRQLRCGCTIALEHDWPHG